MGNIVIIGILVVVIALSLVHARKHFRGGGCCGSGSTTIRTKKVLTEPEIGRLTLVVRGMKCENCQARVENALNRLDGVACTVSLRKKTALVRYSRPVEMAELAGAVERLGYGVEIRNYKL